MRPQIICSHPGCPQAAVKNGRCERHKSIGYQRDKAKQNLYDSAWERSRIAYLIDHPWCHDCNDIATEIHHIKAHRGNRQVFWDKSNWMSLCKPCHSVRTGHGE